MRHERDSLAREKDSLVSEKKALEAKLATSPSDSFDPEAFCRTIIQDIGTGLSEAQRGDWLIYFRNKLGFGEGKAVEDDALSLGQRGRERRCCRARTRS